MSSRATTAAVRHVLQDIVAKGVERIGRKQLWRVVTALRGLPVPSSMSAVRDTLRDVGVFVADVDVALLSETFGRDAVGIDALLTAFLGLFPPRRAHVVDLVVKKLDPSQSGAISAATLCREYDTLRHPDVVNRIRESAQILSNFVSNFDMSEGFLSTEALRVYYLGLSHVMPNDTDFELLCMRSFSLDRPRLNLDGSCEVSRQSCLLKENKVHPLYTTHNSEYGSTASQAAPPNHQYGISQEFTRNVPPRSGGATSMNM